MTAAVTTPRSHSSTAFWEAVDITGRAMPSATPMASIITAMWGVPQWESSRDMSTMSAMSRAEPATTQCL